MTSRPVDIEETDHEILMSIRGSLRELRGQARPQSAPQPLLRGGLNAVADVVHKGPTRTMDLDKMSYEEQLRLALEKSRLETATKPLVENSDYDSEEEEIKRAIEESKKSLRPTKCKTPPTDELDDEIAFALKISMDPNEQENPEYRDHFQRLSGRNLSELGAAAPERIYSVDELEERKRSRPLNKQQPTLSTKLAAKFGHTEQKEEFYNEDLLQAQIEEAIQASLRDIERGSRHSPRSVSLSPTTQYAKVAAKGTPRKTTPPPRENGFSPMRNKTPPKHSGYQAPSIKKTRKKGSFRPIVVDGCNVAFAHGRDQVFSAQGLLICYNYFNKMGYDDSDIIIIVKHVPRLSSEDLQLMEFLKKIGVLHECPSRFVGSSLIRSDDDLMVLDIAKQNGGIVVSRDRFTDNYRIMTTYHEVIEKRLIQPTFIGDTFYLPQDPLGRNGPTLSRFLKFD